MDSNERDWNLSEGCRTCLAIPGKIIAISPENPDSALVDMIGTRCETDVTLIQDDQPGPGDWVLIHVGFAMTKISEDEALAQLRVLEMLGEKGVVREICGFGLADEDDVPRRSNQEQSEA